MTIRCLEFVKNLYAVVDNPTTDSIISWGPNGDSLIVWNPLECCKVLQINNFETFEYYGFKKVKSKPLQFSCDDFVKGQPGILENISKRFTAKLQDFHAKDVEGLMNLVKDCKTNKERELVLKKHCEDFGVEISARIHQSLANDYKELMETAETERQRRGQALPKELEDILRRVVDEFSDLANTADP